jgi:hypothetical protein
MEKTFYKFESKSKLLIIAVSVLLCVMFTPVIIWIIGCCVLILMPIAFCIGLRRLYDLFFP